MYSSSKKDGIIYSLKSSNSLCVFKNVLLSLRNGYSIPVLGKFSTFFLYLIELLGKGDFDAFILTDTEFVLLFICSAAPFYNLKLDWGCIPPTVLLELY